MLIPLFGGNVSRPFIPPIEQSVIFDGSSAFDRTPSVDGDRQNWTFAAWVRIVPGTAMSLFIAGASSGGGAAYTGGYINANGTISLWWNTPSAAIATSTAVFRDIGWYHIALSADGSNLTLYVNGEQRAQGAISGNGAVNHSAEKHSIGDDPATGSAHLHGALADVHFLDGTALTEAQINATFLRDWPHGGGTIQAPKAASGLTYGTNGVHLDFSNASAFGEDQAGSNDWTPTGFVGGDQSLNVPGREYPIINPLIPSNVTYSDGGLTAAIASGESAKATLGAATGEWYFEVKINNVANTYIGICSDNVSAFTSYTPTGESIMCNNVGNLFNGVPSLVPIDALPSIATNDVIGVAFDADAKRVWWSKNGQWYTADAASESAIAVAVVEAGNNGYDFSSWSGDVIFPAFGTSNSGNNITANFGQRSFVYTPPAGFKALHTGNLPTPEYHGGDWFNTLLYSGDSTTNRNVTGAGFEGDLAWFKDRGALASHVLIDRLRSGYPTLFSNTAEAEIDENEFQNFIADGVTISRNPTYDRVNLSGHNYALWLWKAGGAGVANTDGSIASTVSVAPSGHFSIITYTGTGVNATVGHGLPGAPEMLVSIPRDDAASSWVVWHKGLTGIGYFVPLNGDAAEAVSAQYTSVSATTYGVGGGANANLSGQLQLTYCFRSVPGLCAVGSYIGNGSADGPFVWTGFKPRWLMVKRVDGTGNWAIWDTARDPYNPAYKLVWADGNWAEITSASYELDVSPQGFKLRNSVAERNASGGTYLYLALAEEAGGGDLPWPLAR